VALEAREGDKVVDQAVMVSCDLSAVWGTIQDQLRGRIKSRLPGFDVTKLFLNATHTHTAPVLLEGQYVIPKEGVIQPAEYAEFLLGRLSDAVAKAWESRKPGGVSWALGHAVVGHNRRAAYENGTSQMYGNTNTPAFRSLEGHEDHGLDLLFFWDAEKNPIAMAVNLSCPSQEVEGRSTVNADFWHDVREVLRAKYGKDLFVLAWCGAAGDQSPHLLYRKAAEERMRVKRGLTRTQEIARRIARAVDDVFDIARGDIRTRVPFVHQVHTFGLPRRKVTEQELAEAKSRHEELAKKPNRTSAEDMHMSRAQSVIDRFEQQDATPDFAPEIHILRLGDVAIATNPFELFLDYGVQMKARSKAVQTFVIQLACAWGSYLPTARGIAGGHYSTEVVSNVVGPEGGKVLVNRTVEAVNALWE